MIEAIGQVTALDGMWAIVTTQPPNNCGHCPSNNSNPIDKKAKGTHQCGNILMSHKLITTKRQLKVKNNIQAQVGDQVTLGITETNLLLISMHLYGIPLLTLLIGILIGQWLGSQDINLHNELSSMIGGLLGLGIGFGIVQYYVKNQNITSKMVILHQSILPNI